MSPAVPHIWLQRSGRPLVPGFGKNAVVQDRATNTGAVDDDRHGGNFHIGLAVVPRLNS